MDVETKEKIKEIWLKNKDTKSSWQMFRENLSSFFNVVNVTSQSADWLLFLGMVRDWRREDMNKRIEDEVKNLTDDDIAEVQGQNRRRTILMLREILNSYERNPKKFKMINISEVRQWYQTIQSIEEAMKRTHLAIGKLKLEAVRTLLPYNQLLKMSPEKIEELRKQVNASFDRILQLRGGERNGQIAVSVG